MLLLSKSRFGPEKFAWTVSRVQNKENPIPEMGVDLVPHSSKIPGQLSHLLGIP